MRHRSIIRGALVGIIFFSFTLAIFWPITKGLVLLPLDLLISNYRPWYSPATILLKNPYMQDSIVQMYPWKHLVFASFKKGIIPFWNPYQHLGMPFMAAMKPMVWYPFNAFYALGEIPAWHALLFLQVFLSMLFAYLLALDCKLTKPAGILAGVAFALSSLMIGVLEFGSEGHVLLWLPLLMLCAKRYIEKQNKRYLVIFGLATTASILAGHLQYAAYVLLLVAGFIVWYALHRKARRAVYVRLLLGAVLGLGIAGVQLVPSLELFSHSYRWLAHSSEIFTRGLLMPHQLFRLFAPDLFGNPTTRDLSIGYIETSGYFGIIPLFFCLYAMVFMRRIVMVRFFTVVFWAALLLSVNGIGHALLAFRVPIVTSGEGGRIFSLVLFSGALLSGFGLVEFIKTNRSRRQIVSMAVFVVLFGLAVASQAASSGVSVFRNIRFPLGILGGFIAGAAVWILTRKKIAWATALFSVFLVVFTFFDLYRLGYRFLTFSNNKFLYPDMAVVQFIRNASRDTLARTHGLVEPELGSYLGVYTIDTYNPLYIERTGRLLHALRGMPDEALPVNKYIIAFQRERALKRVVDFLGASLIVTEKDANPSIEYFDTVDFQNDFRLMYKDDRFAVYQNTAAVPRFGLYYQTMELHDDALILRQLSDPAFDARKQLILEEPLPVRLEEGTGSATLLFSDVNTQRFSVVTDTPALLYVSDTYFPGWRATVDGQQTKLYRANYNLRAIMVPKGETQVVFTYLPSNFWLAAGISAGSLVLLLAFLFI